MPLYAGKTNNNGFYPVYTFRDPDLPMLAASGMYQP